MRNSVFRHGSSPSPRVCLIRRATCSLAHVSSFAGTGTGTDTLSSRQSNKGKQPVSTLALSLVTALGPDKPPTFASMSLDSRKMPPDADDKKAEKSYLTSAVESINPWASSRTSTPTLDNKPIEPRPPPPPPAASGDHSITPLYGQSLRTYPKDCPPLEVQWFHAVDVPKRKPRLIKTVLPPQKDAKPPARPKKFTAFSPSDSRRLEARYQKLLEAAEDGHASPSRHSGARSVQPKHSDAPKSSRGSTTKQAASAAKTGIRVPVNEDFLFHVDIEERELAPVYWLGPVYEARRGTWFFQEGSSLRPCEENLAAQLEEGYLKTKPWLLPAPPKTRTDPKADGAAEELESSKPVSETASNASASSLAPQLHSYRLFGAYMSNVATYQDACTAWLSTDGVLSWVTTSVYERFAGGGYMSGVKLVRGYTEPNKTKDKDEKPQNSSSQGPAGLDEREEKTRKRKSAPPSSRDSSDDPRQRRRSASNHMQHRQTKLERELSSLLDSEGKSTAETEEQIRKRDELEIQDDYNAQAGEAQGREIEHLVLVTHGIGQRLGLRMESVNFVHDVNVLRKTLKSVYTGSADLKALNSELDAGPGNCRVQVLPVCWRHLIEFPKQRQRRSERDLGDVDDGEDRYPSLEDITVEGVAFARSLISDLALDVLLYQSSYRDEISKIVVAESNRILRLFREQNPEFKGKVHLMGHSLGSAIYFDVLCRQRSQPPLRSGPQQGRQGPKTKSNELQFDFPVHNYFCLGSPVGLFQMLKGRTIAARPQSDRPPAEMPLHPREAEDAFSNGRAASSGNHVSSTTGLSPLISSPKVEQLFNIFHPSDPVSYRLEPLISPAMAALKPQQLPYTKKGIFGNVAPQGLTGIGARVGQSVSGLWSSFSAGIASNLLNRSLGLTSEEVSRMAADEAARRRQPGAEGPGAGDLEAEGRTNERKQQLADSAAKGRQHSAALIDDELETLFSKFQRSRTSAATEGDSARAVEESRRARKLRAEEVKVRALNRNGRVDYSIQESALDFNPINTIASHMGYWADEDVNHFVLSQLLSSRAKADGKGR